MIPLESLQFFIDNFSIRYVHDVLINNFNTVEKHYNIDFNYEYTVHKQVPYFPNKCIVRQLPERCVYLVAVNTYSPDIGHNYGELFVLFQIFENFLKNKPIDGYSFRICTRADYFHDESVRHFIQHTDLKNYIDSFDTESFYRGNFFYINIHNYCPNFHLKYEIRKDFYTINEKCVHAANIKYKGYPIVERMWIYRNLNIDTYWHKRFFLDIDKPQLKECLTKHNFNKMNFPHDCIDFTHQIYLASNCKIIFSEIGKFFINVFFMKMGASVISTSCPSILIYNGTLQNACKTNGVNLFLYETTVDDINNKYYNYSIHGNPYKTTDINEFTQWIDTTMMSISDLSIIDTTTNKI